MNSDFNMIAFNKISEIAGKHSLMLTAVCVYLFYVGYAMLQLMIGAF